MKAKVYVKDDWQRDGVALVVTRDMGGGVHQVRQWPLAAVRTVMPDEPASEPDGDEWLHLGLDEARAVYEALGDHFGHAGHDIRALRKDYDAERARVDRLIRFVIEDPA